MKHQKTALLLALIAGMAPLSAKDLSIVPYPKQVKLAEEAPFELKDGFTIKAAKEFAAAADLFIEDAADLYALTGSITDDKANIVLKKDENLTEEAYSITVKKAGVMVKAANYKSMVMALTSLLQMVETDKSIPACAIKDVPSFPYRCFMLDVARQWNELDTIKQIVDLCRWYKVRYVQIHISDDQQFTFESKAYPKLTEGTRHYTQEQLKDLVEYATQRGVIIIPEFDLPGHSTAMRRQMPELFGQTGWSMIDIANPECMKAIKTITKEMMDIFHTSPYFHIGADEVWLGAYEKLDHVKEYIQKNKAKVDNTHDLYMRFIVEMHDFVKSQGKQTLVWESFGGTGSKKVPIPKDIIVMAWETLYQQPQSLVDNGYTIINATWKPCYIIPHRRWAPEYIYNWNARLWENHTASCPSYKNPIQLGDKIPLMGVQMDAWEMADHEQLLSANKRIAAFSETAWNDNKKQSYERYAPRAEAADAKVLQVIFPAEEERSGFKAPDPSHINDNRVNYFGHEASVFFKPLAATDSVHYTTDRSMPSAQSPKMTEPLQIKTSTYVKFVVVDKDGKVKGYKSCYYLLKPLDYEVSGDVLPLRDRTRGSYKDKENFCDSMTITLTNNYPDTEVYYTLDGKAPNNKSLKYTGPITVTATGILHAAALNSKGNAIGTPTKFNVVKKDRNAPID